MAQLNLGDTFPTLSGETVKHGTLALPDAIPENHYAVVMTYRAHW